VAEGDLEDALRLGRQLWPDEPPDVIRAEFEAALTTRAKASFIVRTLQGEAVAFMNLSLRRDYVPGAETSPVAYLEGIYVAEGFRRQGIAEGLLERAEGWAREQGCRELASDALLENTQSHAFHEAVGFREEERIVCYIKGLED
jgi:aminoglycoside 6'-N-acetyltransferase I